MPIPMNATPTVVMTVREFHPLDRSVQATGVDAMTTEDIRWGRCDIKSVNLLANVLARQRVKAGRGLRGHFSQRGIRH